MLAHRGNKLFDVGDVLKSSPLPRCWVPDPGSGLKLVHHTDLAAGSLQQEDHRERRRCRFPMPALHPTGMRADVTP